MCTQTCKIYSLLHCAFILTVKLGLQSFILLHARNGPAHEKWVKRPCKIKKMEKRKSCTSSEWEDMAFVPPVWPEKRGLLQHCANNKKRFSYNSGWMEEPQEVIWSYSCSKARVISISGQVAEGIGQLSF